LLGRKRRGKKISASFFCKGWGGKGVKGGVFATFVGGGKRKGGPEAALGARKEGQKLSINFQKKKNVRKRKGERTYFKEKRETPLDVTRVIKRKRIERVFFLESTKKGNSWGGTWGARPGGKNKDRLPMSSLGTGGGEKRGEVFFDSFPGEKRGGGTTSRGTVPLDVPTRREGKTEQYFDRHKKFLVPRGWANLVDNLLKKKKKKPQEMPS